MGTFGLSMVVWGAFFQVLVVAVAVQRLGAAEGGAGLLASAAGIGAILGAIGSAGLVGRPRLVPAMAAGVIAWSAALVALAVTTATVVAYAMVIVTGTGLVLMDVVTFTLLQRAADDRLLARVFGVLESLMRAAIGIGALTVAALASVTSLSTTLVLVGALQPIGLLVAWRGLSRVDRLAAADPARIRLLRSVELFSFLPPAELERVASHLQRIDAEAGEVLMRQGDRGDRVFLVESGVVEVIRDGFHVTDLGPGLAGGRDRAAARRAAHRHRAGVRHREALRARAGRVPADRDRRRDGCRPGRRHRRCPAQRAGRAADLRPAVPARVHHVYT